MAESGVKAVVEKAVEDVEFNKALKNDFESAIEGFELDDDEKSLIKAATEGCKESKGKLSEFLPDVEGQGSPTDEYDWYPGE